MSRSYVLVTAAYNEEGRIEETIKSVINQTHIPRKWIIVSDSSTDRTDDIIRDYAARYKFITYARQEKRDIDAKRLEKVSIAQARAMALALEQLHDVEYEFLGNLDADITFEAEYYEKVINKLCDDPILGIAGGGAYNINPDGTLAPGGFIKPYFVGGPIQLFRRKCLEDIGGYSPYGHSDCIAIAKARMKGWKVQCFPEIRAFHHEVPSNTVREKMPTCFRMGQMDYIMGGLFIFEVVRCTVRMFNKPFLLAGIAMLSGYVWGFITRKKIQISNDVIKYMQAEQMQKLLSKLPFKR